MSAAMKKGDDAIRYLGDLQRLGLKPGDRFVLKVDRPLTIEQHARIQEAWRNFAGGDADQMKLLVLDSGMEIGIIGKS